MSTLYVHPRNYAPRHNHYKHGAPNKSPRHLRLKQEEEEEEEKWYESNSYFRSKDEQTSNNNKHEEKQSYYDNDNDDDNCNEVPPQLFFPIEHISGNQQTHHQDDEYQDNEYEDNEYQEQQYHQQQSMEYLQQLPLINDNYGFDIESIESSQFVEELNQQRIENEKLLIKLRDDERKYLKVHKHYEKKNTQLKLKINEFETNNPNIVRDVKNIKDLLIEHQKENKIHQQQSIDFQLSRNNLWQSVSKNMQLLQNVNNLNKQIDQYHLLIAKKSQQVKKINRKIKHKFDKDKDKDKDNENNKDNKEDQKKQEETKEEEEDINDYCLCHDNNNNIINDGCCYQFQSDQDELQFYADKIAAKNKRYHQILQLLRNKVDQLRQFRVRL